MEYEVMLVTLSGKETDITFTSWKDAESTFYFYGDNKKAFGLKTVGLLEIAHGEYEDHFEYTEAI